MYTLELQRVEQPDHVAREQFDGIIAQGHAAFAMPTGIVAQDAKMFFKYGDLRIPQI